MNERRNLAGKQGGLNGSMQDSTRTQFAMKTKAEWLPRVRSNGTLLWLGFDGYSKTKEFF